MSSIKENVLKIIRGQSSIKDVWYYFQGNYRYKLYYSQHFKWLIRTHIKQQIDYRITYMDKKCYETGSCKICGCQTTALQMCNKSCDKPCYPRMLTWKEWTLFLKGMWINTEDSEWWSMDRLTGKPILHKYNNPSHVFN